jgi:hypothetical protein
MQTPHNAQPRCNGRLAAVNASVTGRKRNETQMAEKKEARHLRNAGLQ